MDEVRKYRGVGKKPALVLMSIRIDTDVYDFFNEHYPTRVQAMMREVLANFAKQHGEIK